MTTVTNQYLEGGFAPVHEEVTLTDLTVHGTIPAELDGRYLRNGPNPLTAPDPARYHWFTGDGMVHGVRLRDGRAEWYRNRWVRSPDVARALGEPVPPSPYGDDRQIFAANTNVIGHAGTTLAIVEAGSPPMELTFDLDTVGPTDFDGTLEAPFSAHPKRDPHTGELHVVAYYWAWGNQVRYLVVGADGRVRHQVDVPTTGGPMVHDLGLSERAVVIMDLPCVFDLEAATQGSTLPYVWKPDYPARLGLLPRDGAADDVVWCEVEPCYVFHPLNTFDLPDGRVVMDAIRHPRMFDSDRLGPNEGETALVRFTIDPSSQKVIEEQLDDHSAEFPRHDERRLGQDYRYGYAATFAPGPELGAGIKYDLATGTSEVRHPGAGRASGELVFVPSSPDAAEDDGWLITFIHDVAGARTTLEIVHAQDFTGDPVAVVDIPVPIPFGFHGNWVPATG